MQQLTKLIRAAGAAAVFISPLPAAAQPAEAPPSERIQQMVIEAQEVAKEWAERLREWKSGVETPSTYFGVVIEPVPDVLRDYIDLPRGVGLLLVKVAEDGPAAKAGVIDNDILVTFDGQLVINYNQLSTLIDMKGPGSVVPVTVLRKGQELKFDVTLEERIRRGIQFKLPEVPQPPEAPDEPVPPPGREDILDQEKVGQLMQRIEEWIPGSVRVYVDKDEQVHVDLHDLKEDLQGLRDKLHKMEDLNLPQEGLVTRHGDFGARTTVIHVADQNINYLSKDGKVSLRYQDGEEVARVWNTAGDLIYDGKVPGDYETALPAEAARLIKELKESRKALDLDPGSDQLEIQLNVDDLQPLTLLVP